MSIRNVPFPWLALWTAGLWLSALAIALAVLFSTQPAQLSDHWLAWTGVVLSAGLATFGTVELAHRRGRKWFRLQFSLRTLFILFALLGIVFSYAGSYVARSLQGRYEPAVIGLGGVKWYDWAPAGFVSDLRWNAPTARFYYPLWRLDRTFWHQPIHSSEPSENYPINEVPPNEIDKVFEAWK